MQNISMDGDGVSLSISIMGNGGTGFREREQYPLIYLKDNDFRFKKNMTYTEEEKKQLKMAFGRMLDNGEDFLAIDIAEVEGRDLVPYIARKRFRVSLIKEGNVENR